MEGEDRGDRSGVVSPIFPRFERWLDAKAYLRRLCTVPVQTKRGCPFECVYCTYPMIEGEDYLLHEPASVVEAIRGYASRGMRDVEFVDNVFNAPYEHALAICEGLAEADCGARLQTMDLNPLFVDDALLDAMERAGFVGFGITPESASDPVLEALCKGFTADAVHRAAEAVRGQSRPCFWVFLLGGPGETETTVRETLDFADRHVRRRDVAYFAVGVRVYPGTALERIARSEGVLTRIAEEMLEPVFYLSPALDGARLRQTVREAVRSHLNFLYSESLDLPWLPKVYRLGHALGLGPPTWRHTRILRRGLRLLGRKV